MRAKYRMQNRATTSAAGMRIFVFTGLLTLATAALADGGDVVGDQVSAGIQAYRSGQLQEAARLLGSAAVRGAPAHAFIKLAQVRQALGQHHGAIAALLALLRENGDSLDTGHTATAHALLGLSYSQLGRNIEAAAALAQARQLAQSSGDAALKALVLNQQGNHAVDRGDHAEALEYFRAAALLAGNTGDQGLNARASTNASRAALQTRRHEDAKSFYRQGQHATATLAPGHDKAYLFIALGRQARQIAQIDDDTQWISEAYGALDAALQLADEIGDARAASFALGYLGQLYEERGRLDDAMALTNRAIFQARRADATEALYRWQWQTARLHAAQGDLDAAIAAYGRTVHTLQGLRQDLSLVRTARQSSFRQTVGPVFFALADLLLTRARQRTDEQTRQADLRAARDTIEQLKAAELRDYFQDDCVTRFQEQSEGLDKLAADTAVIYPILLPDRTEILLGLGDGIQQFSVPVGAALMSEEIDRLRRRLEKRTTRQYRRHARKLYQWLIAPIAPTLDQHGIKTLVVVPDGALRTIPLAALHDGEDFLIARYALATTPGLKLTDPKPLRRQQLHLLLNGLTEAVQGFSALPNVAGEIDNIAKLYNSRVLRDSDYLVESVGQELKSTPYRIVHIASHGQFDGDPEKSFLLAYDDKLTMDRLETYMGLSRYSDEPVELLTLSACQTAAGDDRAALGLAGVAIKAGARSALATLWFVNDEASSKLVTEFYRQLGDASLSKAEALRRAQLMILKQPRYGHPSYWAPFLLIGNWL